MQIKSAPCLLTGAIAAVPFGHQPRVAAGRLISGVYARCAGESACGISTHWGCAIRYRGAVPHTQFVSLRRLEKGGGRALDRLSGALLPCAGFGHPLRDAVRRQRHAGPALPPQADPQVLRWGAGAFRPGPAAEAHPAADPPGAAGPSACVPIRHGLPVRRQHPAQCRAPCRKALCAEAGHPPFFWQHPVFLCKGNCLSGGDLCGGSADPAGYAVLRP